MPRRIHVFVRHCKISQNSIHKVRPTWFSKEAALENLLSTKDEATHVTVLLDTASGTTAVEHFTAPYAQQGQLQVVERAGGTDAHSFIELLHYVCAQPESTIAPDDIVYLLEDDYVHVPGWTTVLREAFDNHLADYVTLYDHADKYTEMYKNLQSSIFVTRSCHWRTVPSTTNTYAMLSKTLRQYKEVHLAFSDTRAGYTFDHNKFLHLGKTYQARLVSCIPGYSTHAETLFLSPVVPWNQICMQMTQQMTQPQHKQQQEQQSQSSIGVLSIRKPQQLL